MRIAQFIDGPGLGQYREPLLTVAKKPSSVELVKIIQQIPELGADTVDTGGKLLSLLGKSDADVVAAAQAFADGAD